MSSVDNTLHEYGADNPVPLSRIHSIIEDGEAAFWSVVADRFPEVKSGCFSWDAQDELSRALELAVRRWLNANTDTCEVCGNREGFNGVELSGFVIRLWNNPDADRQKVPYELLLVNVSTIAIHFITGLLLAAAYILSS